MLSDPGGEIRKTTESISISGDQLAAARFNMQQCPKAIDLQFKEKLVGIEWLWTTGKPDGTKVSREHGWSIAVKGITVLVMQALTSTLSSL
jgi:hypothetical protein